MHGGEGKGGWGKGKGKGGMHGEGGMVGLPPPPKGNNKKGISFTVGWGTKMNIYEIFSKVNFMLIKCRQSIAIFCHL